MLNDRYCIFLKTTNTKVVLKRYRKSSITKAKIFHKTLKNYDVKITKHQILKFTIQRRFYHFCIRKMSNTIFTVVSFCIFLHVKKTCIYKGNLKIPDVSKNHLKSK